MTSSVTPPDDALPVVREPDPRPALLREGRAGANWFFVLAGFSLASAMLRYWGQDWGQPLELSLTLVAEEWLRVLENHQPGVPRETWSRLALGSSMVASLLFTLVGWWSRHRQLRVYAAGMTGYLLDGLLCLVMAHWWGLVFHGIVLSGLWCGWSAYRELARWELEQACQQLPLGPELPP